MTRPNRPTRTYDRTGTRLLAKHEHVKIVFPNHAYFGFTGTIVRVAHPKVWIALPGGTVVRASHYSVEVIVPQSSR